MGDSEGSQGLCNNATQICVAQMLQRQSVESGPRSGRPATSRTPENVERVWAAINKDWRLTVRELEADLGIPKTTLSEI